MNQLELLGLIYQLRYQILCPQNIFSEFDSKSLTTFSAELSAFKITIGQLKTLFPQSRTVCELLELSQLS